MQDREIEAIEKAITNATVDELYEECQRYRRHKSAAAQETLAILQRLLSSVWLKTSNLRQSGQNPKNQKRNHYHPLKKNVGKKKN